jgi:hypothetical protein
MTQFVKAFRELSYALGFIHDCVSRPAAATAAAAETLGQTEPQSAAHKAVGKGQLQ